MSIILQSSVDYSPISFNQVKEELREHIFRKGENHIWLSQARFSLKAFPYCLHSKKAASIGKKKIFSLQKQQEKVSIQSASLSERKIAYILNIPLVINKDGNLSAQYRALVEKIKRQAFSDKQAQVEALKNLAVVIGINQHSSLDKEDNRAFCHLLKTLPEIEGIVVETFAFLWEPSWEILPDMKAKKHHIYSPEKSFLLLKVLDPAAALKVKKELQGEKGLSKNLKKQIPYQEIREKILASDATMNLFQGFSQSGKMTYLAVIDDDTLSFGVNEGIFSTYDQLIEEFEHLENELPEVLSTGYSLESEEAPILRLAVEIDMAVREATAYHIPLGPYYPEPNFLFRLFKNAKGMPSFLGAGSNLESRRLIENFRNLYKRDPKALFRLRNPLITKTPPRMRSKKAEKIGVLNAKTIRKKSVLQSLRGVSQSHAFPKQWADNLYEALPLKVPVTQATGPLMRIFNIFHPISLIFSIHGEEGKYSPEDFDKVMGFYEKYLSDFQRIIEGGENLEALEGAFEALQIEDPNTDLSYAEFFHRKAKEYLKEKAKLEKFQELDSEMIRKISMAARDSACAVYNILRSFA